MARKGYLFVLAASVTGATSAVAIRTILGHLSIAPMALAFWREFLTFLTLLFGLALIRPRLLRIKRRDLGLLMAAGMVGLGPAHVLWVIAVSRISMAMATILHYTFPAFVVLLSCLIWHEAITRRKVNGLLLTFLGVVLVAGPFEVRMVSTEVAGPAAALGTGVTFALYSVLSKQALVKYNPWTVMTYAFGFSSIAVLTIHVTALSSLPRLPLSALGGMMMLTLGSTILPFGLYLTGLSFLPASAAAITMTFEVVAAMLFGYLIFSETVAVLQAAGALLIVLGIILVNRGVARQ